MKPGLCLCHTQHWGSGWWIPLQLPQSVCWHWKPHSSVPLLFRFVLETKSLSQSVTGFLDTEREVAPLTVLWGWDRNRVDIQLEKLWSMTQNLLCRQNPVDFGTCRWTLLCASGIWRVKPEVCPRKQLLRSSCVALRSSHHPLRSVVLSEGFGLCFLI